MGAGPRVFAGMPVRRGVAAERHATRLAGSKVQPLRANLDAFLTGALTRLLDLLNGFDVGARLWHNRQAYYAS